MLPYAVVSPYTTAHATGIFVSSFTVRLSIESPTNSGPLTRISERGRADTFAAVGFAVGAAGAHAAKPMMSKRTINDFICIPPCCMSFYCVYAASFISSDSRRAEIPGRVPARARGQFAQSRCRASRATTHTRGLSLQAVHSIRTSKVGCAQSDRQDSCRRYFRARAESVSFRPPLSLRIHHRHLCWHNAIP